MFSLPFVEIMITQVCNLSCEGCTNYSDIKHTGYLTWDQGEKWFSSWKNVINIEEIGIMGGEPLINPQWLSWLFGIRKMFPNSPIRFTTNGLLLDRHPDILDLLDEIGNVVFKITVHVENEKLENTISSLLSQRNWKPIKEFGINRFIGNNKVRFQINRPTTFLRLFKNNYNNMAPWNSNPKEAFSTCIQQTCPLMYKGKIYKCSTSALLADTLERFGHPNWEQWRPYLVDGISPSDDLLTIKNFIMNFGKSESICAQCPDNNSEPLNHLKTVSIKRG
jgi:organic radical activating enzyme